MNKSPPNRKQLFVEEMLNLANDDSHGYSQKPPSGRWGPDFDCSSLIYYAANKVGYDVEMGPEKVRFTGTMLKDFEKAGFQILPFANVGISDLQIGDILLNLALHAEVYVGEGESVAATGSENGGFIGESGDQTSREIEKHPVQTFDKEWDYILRPPEDENEEGDEMPMNYMQPNNQGWSQSIPQPNNMNGSIPSYPMNNGYPQGNLGQMNGYSQANAGNRMPYGYPQGGVASNDLIFVMGIEGAKNCHGAPNSRQAVFDEDKPLMYIVGFDQSGNVNSINVYHFEECSEEMPQHLSPLMRGNMQNAQGMGNNYVTREEFDRLKEMIENAKSTVPEQSNSQQSNSSRNRRNSQPV